MGDRVAVLDPFDVTGVRDKDRLNPLDLIDIHDQNATDDAAVIAKLICRDGVIRTDPFWDARAESLIIDDASHLLWLHPDIDQVRQRIAQFVKSSSVLNSSS